MVDESLADKTGDEGYPGSTIAAAVLATVFFPLLSLIAALFLHGRETNPVKKSSLRTWALASAGWMAAQLVLAVVLFAVATSGSGVDTSGPCEGGPAIGVAGDERPDRTTVFPCEFGGSVTLTLP